MPDEHIIENTEAYLNVVRPLQGYKKKAAEYGPHSRVVHILRSCFIHFISFLFLLGEFIFRASLSAEGCSERFGLHLPTLGMTEGEATQWFEDDRKQREETVMKREVTAHVQTMRPLLKRELRWHMTSEELDKMAATEREERIKQEERIMNFTDKQRRKYNEEMKERKREEEEATARYEAKLAHEYRKLRLQRLSPEVRDQIDLEERVRDPIHIWVLACFKLEIRFT